MNLSMAVLCLDCEEVYDRERPACPACGRSARYPIKGWLEGTSIRWPIRKPLFGRPPIRSIAFGGGR